MVNSWVLTVEIPLAHQVCHLALLGRNLTLGLPHLALLRSKTSLPTPWTSLIALLVSKISMALDCLVAAMVAPVAVAVLLLVPPLQSWIDAIAEMDAALPLITNEALKAEVEKERQHISDMLDTARNLIATGEVDAETAVGAARIVHGEDEEVFEPWVSALRNATDLAKHGTTEALRRMGSDQVALIEKYQAEFDRLMATGDFEDDEKGAWALAQTNIDEGLPTELEKQIDELEELYSETTDEAARAVIAALLANKQELQGYIDKYGEVVGPLMLAEAEKAKQRQWGMIQKIVGFNQDTIGDVRDAYGLEAGAELEGLRSAEVQRMQDELGRGLTWRSAWRP